MGHLLDSCVAFTVMILDIALLAYLGSSCTLFYPRLHHVLYALCYNMRSLSTSLLFASRSGGSCFKLGLAYLAPSMECWLSSIAMPRRNVA